MNPCQSPLIKVSLEKINIEFIDESPTNDLITCSLKIFQIFTVLSHELLKSRSFLIFKHVIESVCPVKFFILRPLIISHTLIVESFDADITLHQIQIDYGDVV